MMNLSTLSVQRIPENDFSKISGATNNGQHWQLAGHVLAEVSIRGGHNPPTFNLYHPQTKASTGHVDVIVEYGHGDKAPKFRIYSGYQAFVPDTFGSGVQGEVWPTGGWSLLQTVFAIESFLVADCDFYPKLRAILFGALQPKPA